MRLAILALHFDKVTKDNKASQIKRSFNILVKSMNGINKICLPVPMETLKTLHFSQKSGAKLANAN
jgi:hypothetical protein